VELLVFALQLLETPISQKGGPSLESHQIAACSIFVFNANLRAGTLCGFLPREKEILQILVGLVVRKAEA
jgi:hypothetical protein